jgi:methylamine dehydrogenase heavy chain
MAAKRERFLGGSWLWVLVAAASVVTVWRLGDARAELAAEPLGVVESLPESPSSRWVWAVDLVLERVSLIDIERERYLGSVPGGYGTFLPLFARTRPEIYIPATYYSRRTRGQRTDVLEIYDRRRLAFLEEIPLPPKRALNRIALNHAALSDDERFVAVFNWTTGTSLSVVDVAARRFVSEISAPGCSLAFAAGARRFFSICPSGALFILDLDEEGQEKSRALTEPFFDPRQDPVTEKAVRIGSVWYFVSFEGVVHPVDASGSEVRFLPTWEIVTPEERAANWRTGGAQHLAAHEKSGRLFVLMHQGEKDTHKEPGSEVWVFDVATQTRLARIPLRFPGLTVYGFPIEPDRGWPWGTGTLFRWALDRLFPAVVTAIAVTPGERPLLLTGCEFVGALGVYDANDGRFLKRVQPIGWTTDLLFAPYGS